MAVHGADADQLRTAATQFSKGASALESSAKTLHSLIGTTTQWRGPDADRFRSQWSSTSARTITAAVNALREAADILRRNATEQEKASAASGGSLGGASASQPIAAVNAPAGLNGLWDELHHVPAHSAGYRVQEVIGTDHVTRYVVYIVGTNSADGQNIWSNIAAGAGVPDDKQLAALRNIIPNGAEVMLVGHSQGGMDAQNIAMQQNNGFTVTQVVTFGSPVRDDLNVPAIHLQADGDHIPGSTNGILASPFRWNSTGANPDAHIYHAKSDYQTQPDILGPGWQIHGNAYGELSKKWDEAQFSSTAGVAKFAGSTTKTIDLGVDGAPIQH